MTPKKGDEFTHKHFVMLDTTTRRPRGDDDPLKDRYIPARMKITAVRKGIVYYTYANSRYNKGAWKMPVESWTRTYGQ